MKKRLFVIGDSISIHYGSFLKDYISDVFEFRRKGGVDGDPGDLDRGNTVNGGDSSLLLDYLKNGQEPVLDADAILINCGLHDIKTNPKTGAKQVPPELYRENLKATFEFLRYRSAKTFWVRTTHVDDIVHNSRNKEFQRFNRDCAAYNRIADEEAASAGIASIDLNGFTQRLGPGVFIDHIHFTEPVRQLQAAFLAGHLLEFARKADAKASSSKAPAEDNGGASGVSR